MQPSLFTNHDVADLNIQAANDEQARRERGGPGIRFRRVLYLHELGKTSGANVTVSRTHTGFSLCFQIKAYALDTTSAMS